MLCRIFGIFYIVDENNFAKIPTNLIAAYRNLCTAKKLHMKSDAETPWRCLGNEIK